MVEKFEDLQGIGGRHFETREAERFIRLDDKLSTAWAVVRLVAGGERDAFAVSAASNGQQ